mgnify:CR=1 FL=1
MIRVMLVDDHEVVRAGIRVLVEGQPDMHVVSEASDGRTAIELVGEIIPDVILMDITMPDMDGLEVTRHVKQCCDTVAVLALTIHEGREYFFAMLNAGAAGYIPKSAPAEELIIAIRAVARGEVYLHSSVASLMLQDYLRTGESDQPGSSALTEREKEVLALVADGLLNREIGEKLAISPKTVARHRENIMRKLGLHTRTDLVKYALSIGLIDIDHSPGHTR